MIIKVCGMRETANIEALQELDIDFMGIIRYPKSKRFVDDNQAGEIGKLTMNKGTVGVYVNATFEQILQDIIPLQLDVIQLHGDEDSSFAKALLALDLKIFKAFQVNDTFDFTGLKEWELLAEAFPGKLFFLFDTATENYGGSGSKFNWQLLDSYKSRVPFVLSGGISQKDAGSLKALKHDFFMGIDINSRFETAPGLKDIATIKTFIQKLRS
jgi:phosphoribosylanthranilate isomerase